VYFPYLPDNIDELRARINGAAAEIIQDKLRHNWEENHYRWDICRTTSASHIEL
jgi:hypothetical protein